VTHYQPFIEDPEHLRELDRQRFVVLRMPSAVTATYGPVQDAVRQRLSALPVSYPARAHVTLCGFVAGTALAAVQEMVGPWARSMPSLLIEVERVSAFPPPFQVVVLQVRKTPELFAALVSLRRRAEERQLVLSTLVPADQWIFHMSVAYCSGLSAPAWHAFTQFVETLPVQSAKGVVGEAEVVAFDEGREYSGGMFSLDAAEPIGSLE
jgi:2'-5' RNA ligase